MENPNGPQRYNDLPPYGGGERANDSNSAENTVDAKDKKPGKKAADKTTESDPAKPVKGAEKFLVDFRHQTGAGSIWERLLPEKPFKDKKEPQQATDGGTGEPAGKEPAPESADVDAAAEIQAAAPIEAEIKEEVSGPEYEEIVPGDFKDAVVEGVDNELAALDQESSQISPDEPESQTILDIREFSNGVRKEVVETADEAPAPADRPSEFEIIESKFQEAWDKYGPADSAEGVQLSEAGDNVMVPSESADLSEKPESNLPPMAYEDMDSVLDAVRLHAAQSAARAGQPPNMYFGPVGAAAQSGGEAGRGITAATPLSETISSNESSSSILPALLLAGAAGAYLGNLHGKAKERRRAEAALLPLQEKLKVQEVEKRVIQADLANKTSQLRQLYQEREQQVTRAETGQLPVAGAAEAAPPPLFERLAEAAPIAAAYAAGQKQAERTAVQPDAAAPAETRQEAPPRDAAPERTIAPSGLPAEQQSAASAKQERQNITQRYVKPAEAMSHSELLEASGNIIVGGESVRQAYEESRDISEASLRRVVAEYQRGGDVRKVLVEEKVKSSYERDPRLRSRSLPSSAAIAGAAQMTEHDGLSDQRALPSGTIGDEESLPPPPSYPLLSNKNDSQVPPALVTVTVGAFVVLGVLVVIMLFVWFLRLL